jgi:hypothetical protein
MDIIAKLANSKKRNIKGAGKKELMEKVGIRDRREIKEKSKVRHICNQQETCGHAYTHIRTHAHISTFVCKINSAIYQ